MGATALEHRAGDSPLEARDAAQRLSAIGDLLAFGVVVIDERGDALYANAAWRHMTGQDDRRWHEAGWLSVLDRTDREGHLGRLLETVGQGHAYESDWLAHTVAGQPVRLHVNARSRFGNEALWGAVVTVRDVTHDQLLLERLSFQASHDSLTGLYHRGQFLEFVGHAIERLRRRPGARVGLVFLDVDGLKTVNDRYGHAEGDDLLNSVAAAITEAIRPDDVACRFGGDEFTVLLEGLHHVDEAMGVASRIVASIGSRSCQGQPIRVSVGLAVTENHSTDPRRLVRDADDAMYLAKEIRSPLPVLSSERR